MMLAIPVDRDTFESQCGPCVLKNSIPKFWSSWVRAGGVSVSELSRSGDLGGGVINRSVGLVAIITLILIIANVVL